LTISSSGPKIGALRTVLGASDREVGMRRTVILALLALSLAFDPGPPAVAGEPLRLGIHPYLSSSEIVRRFKPLADYLGRELKVPVAIEIADSYTTHIRNVGTGSVDIGFLGPASYVALIDQYGPKPILAAFETSGKRTFRGVIVARRESPIADLGALKGKRFAFGDRQSTMSHLVPRQMLLEKGVAAGDLADFQFLTNHDNIALGVLGGDFDAGALKEDIFKKYEPEGLKAIAFSEEFADHVFVASSRVSAATAQTVRKALLELKDRPGGAEVLAAIQPGLSALVPAEDRAYDNLRIALKELKAAGVEP
jgi:phosphonate transport system substrate-binding protein